MRRFRKGLRITPGRIIFDRFDEIESLSTGIQEISGFLMFHGIPMMADH